MKFPTIPPSPHPNTVKKTVVGQGHAEKNQVQHMLSMLFPAITFKNADAADALAIAVTGAYLARPFCLL